MELGDVGNSISELSPGSALFEKRHRSRVPEKYSEREESLQSLGGRSSTKVGSSNPYHPKNLSESDKKCEQSHSLHGLSLELCKNIVAVQEFFLVI